MKTKILMEPLFPPVYCQIFLLYVLCRLSPYLIAENVSMKYLFATDEEVRRG